MTPTRRRANAIAIDNDALRFAAGRDTPPATAEPAPAPAKGKTGANRSGTGAVSPAVVAPTAIVEPNPDALEGELFPGEPRIKIGTVLPAHLKGQVDGAVRFAQDTGEIEGVETIADFIRVACSRLVVDLQARHRDGQEFDQPRMNRRGRTPSR